jgi:hypothetical protein
MQSDTVKLIFTFLIAIGVIGAGFYSLVIYPFQLDDLVKGAIISFMTLAMQAVFADQIAARVGHQQQNAFDAGLTATPNSAMPTITTSAGPPATTTITPPEPVVAPATEFGDEPTLSTRGEAP